MEERILEAGLHVFALHGFSRASMTDIAREAGLARGTLYLHYPDKGAVFEALAESLVTRALEGAEAAWRDDALLPENLAAVILAKDLAFFRLMKATPHGADLLALDADLTRRHGERLDAGFKALLARRARELEAQGLSLEAFGGARGFAPFVTAASAGLKHEVGSEEAYRGAVRRLASVVSAATRAGPAASGPA